MRLLFRNEFVNRGPSNNTIAFEVCENENEVCIIFKGRLVKKFANIFVDSTDCKTHVRLSDIESEAQLRSILADKTCECEHDIKIDGSQTVQEIFAERHLGTEYRRLSVADIDELVDVMYILRVGKYVVVFDTGTPRGLSVKDFAISIEPEQRIAILQDNSVVWLGKASQLICCDSTDKLLDSTIKGIKFTSSEFCTFYGGNTQSWSGLLITI